MNQGQKNLTSCAKVSLSSLALPIAIPLSLAFMLLSIQEPLTYDELWGFQGGMAILSKGIPISWTGEYDLGNPPLYYYVLALFFQLFGVSDVAARIPGIIGTIGTGLLLFAIGRMTTEDRDKGCLIGSLASVLYLLNPATIQGALIVDIDCALLPVLSVTMIVCFLWAVRGNGGGYWILCGLSLCVSLWAKLTTPLLLLGIIALYIMVDRGLRSGIHKAAIVAFWGIGGFLLSWGLYTKMKHIPFWYPFDYLVGSFVTKQLTGSAWERLNLAFRSFTQLSLWWSPFLLLLALIGGFERIKRFFQNRRMIIWDALALFFFSGALAYILVGGITFGFPKYHAPFLPIVSFLLAGYLVYMIGETSKRELMIIALFIAGGVVWCIYLVGDPLLTLNFALRDAMIHDPLNTQNIIRDFLRQIALSCLLAVVMVTACCLLFMRSGLYRNCVLGLMATLLSSWLAMNIIQAKADYLTRFCYGDRETKKMISFLKREISPNDVILATRDIVFYVKDELPCWDDSLWKSLIKFKETIERPDVRYVVFSVGHHSIVQYRDIFFHPEVVEKLEGGYSKSQIGTYTVWTRK